MRSRDKLTNAQDALSMFIDSLTEEDHFAIQSFGVKGTEKLWGFLPANEEEKEEAKQANEYSKTNTYQLFYYQIVMLKGRQTSTCKQSWFSSQLEQDCHQPGT